MVVCLVLAVFAVSPFLDDGDQASRALRQKYGETVFEQTQTANCATDGVGIKVVPFGRVIQHCDTKWFVLGIGDIIVKY